VLDGIHLLASKDIRPRASLRPIGVVASECLFSGNGIPTSLIEVLGVTEKTEGGGTT